MDKTIEEMQRDMRDITKIINQEVRTFEVEYNVNVSIHENYVDPSTTKCSSIIKNYTMTVEIRS